MFPGIFGDISRNFCQFLKKNANISSYKLNLATQHEECLKNVPRNVWRHSPKCFTTFLGMFGDIPQNVLRHSMECLGTFPGMFCDIPRNITFPHSPRSPHSVPRSCIPVFIHSQSNEASWRGEFNAILFFLSQWIV